MNRDVIPKIKISAAFYGVLKVDLIKWIEGLPKEISLGHEWKELKKQDIMKILDGLYKNEKYHELLHERIKNEFEDSTGIGPKDTESILECTTTERKRWEKSGKLDVSNYFEAGTRRHPINIPMYSRLQLESITEEEIQAWRDEHETNKENKRKLKESYEEMEVRYVIAEGVKQEYISKVIGPLVYYKEEDLQEQIDYIKEQMKEHFRDGYTFFVKEKPSNQVIFVENL